MQTSNRKTHFTQRGDLERVVERPTSEEQTKESSKHFVNNSKLK